MWSENLAYALVQVLHNIGAVAVTGGAILAMWPLPRLEYARRFAWVILAGWSVQIVSGALFGATSLYYYGETPDLSMVAMSALAIKVAAAFSGLLLSAWFLGRGGHCSHTCTQGIFKALAVLAVTALTAAAFLRWFS